MIEKIDQTKFNLMPLPRSLVFRKQAKRGIGYAIGGIFGLIFLATLIGLGFSIKHDLENLNFKKNGIKLVGRIDQIKKVTDRYGTKNVVNFSYQYSNSTYYGAGVERYGVHKPADSISVYISPADPKDSRAEFSIGEESEVYHRIRSSFNILLVPAGVVLFLFLLVAPAFWYDRFVDKKIFANGRMVSARVLKVVGGRASYAEIEFSTSEDQVIATTVARASSTTAIKSGDVIQVVYLPSNFRKARIFPSFFFDVVIDSQFG